MIKGKQKAFFIIFKGLSVVNKCVKPESKSLSYSEMYTEYVILHQTEN